MCVADAATQATRGGHSTPRGSGVTDRCAVCHVAGCQCRQQSHAHIARRRHLRSRRCPCAIGSQQRNGKQQSGRHGRHDRQVPGPTPFRSIAILSHAPPHARCNPLNAESATSCGNVFAYWTQLTRAHQSTGRMHSGTRVPKSSATCVCCCVCCAWRTGSCMPPTPMLRPSHRVLICSMVSASTGAPPMTPIPGSISSG